MGHERNSHERRKLKERQERHRTQTDRALSSQTVTATRIRTIDQCVDANGRMAGVVTSEVNPKGFAFAKGEDGRTYFVHTTQCAPGVFAQLQKGTEISFTPHPENVKGPRAINVQLA